MAERLTIDYAEAEIKEALDRREEHFLRVVRAGVFEASRSPYRPLFRWVGCEFGDLETSVRRHGVDRTLEELAGGGVYFTSDEFKGKKTVERGNTAFRVTPEDFLPQASSPAFATASSGTMNRPVRSFITLGWLAQRALAVAVAFSAHGLLERAHAIFDGIFPAGGGVNNVLMYGQIGVHVDRWFTRSWSVDTWLVRRYNALMTRAIIAACNRYGPGIGGLEHVDQADFPLIVEWIQKMTRGGRRCCITTAASNAARIARVAAQMGVSLEGTKFIATGEPLTEAKRDVIERVGASAMSRYAYGGGVNVGFGCADPLEADDVHVNEHLMALVPHPQPISPVGPPIHPLLCTTLHPAAPRLLINVQSGDYGTFMRRACGCALGRAGLTLHIHHVRSFEKFTSEGMNYYHWDLFRLLEGTLPAEFGGGPGDYQLVEEEDESGQTRLTLRVSRAVGPLDDSRLLSRLHDELAKASYGHRFMETVWKLAGTIRISREEPYASPRGKTLPLHIPH
ncbi:MAG: hypothetical protein ACRDGN_15850 [bacterium]